MNWIDKDIILEVAEEVLCDRFMINGMLCGHPEWAPIHKPAEGCTADGGRCDHPHIHHSFRAFSAPVRKEKATK